MKAMTRRHIIGATATFALLGMSTLAHAADKVTLSLNWVPGGNHVGFYLANEQGFYKAEGLDVEIQRGYGSGDTVKRVATGAAQIGVGDSASVLVGRSNGQKVKMISALFSHAADAIFFLEGKDISKPKDLEGRSIGGTTGETTLNLLPTFAKATGTDFSKLKVVNLASSAKPASLASKSVDALVGFVNEEPGIRSAVEKAGEKLGKFKFTDVGIDYYSIGLIASDETIAKNPDMLKRFIRATLKGYALAIKDPALATAAFVKVLPEANPAIVREQFDIAKSLIASPQTASSGIGFIDETRMTKTIDLIKGYQKVDSSLTAKDIFTMSLFEKVPLE
jgi:NitT/TauT family transport system substrate-binding protein